MSSYLVSFGKGRYLVIFGGRFCHSIEDGAHATPQEAVKHAQDIQAEEVAEVEALLTSVMETPF